MAQRIMISAEERQMLNQVKQKLGEIIDHAFMMTKKELGNAYPRDAIFDTTFKRFMEECTKMMVLENEMEKGMNLD
jgi:hypothetical protein